MKRHEGVVLDGDALSILECIWDHGRISTREVTATDDVTVTDNDRVRYRFQKLSEAGLVNVQDATMAEAGGIPPKIAQITKDGDKAVRQGLLGDVYSSTIDLRESNIKDRLDDLEKDTEWLLDESVAKTERLVAIWRALEDNGIDPHEYWPEDV